ncbi:[histone H3]-lysine(4) N-trimethyltransferase [Ranunculus cassubicifolius]
MQISRDILSELPEEITYYTLSFLPIREAARTSILAHRWRELWKTSVRFYSCLRLDLLDKRGSSFPERKFIDNPFVMEDELEFSLYEDAHLKILTTERIGFLNWADHIMQLDCNSVIDTFKLRFYLKKDYSHHIDQWMKTAIAKKAQNFDVDLSCFDEVGITDDPNEDLYTFPLCLFSHESRSLVKSLRLTSCIFEPLHSTYFSSMVELQLESVLLNQDDFTKFLRNCVNLENLVLDTCSNLVILEICSPKLKHFTLHYCFGLKNVMIDARKLTRFQYYGGELELSFQNVPRLTNAAIYMGRPSLTYALEKLSSDLPNLESLFLKVAPIQEVKISTQLPLFANLKEVKLMVVTADKTLWDLIYVVRASPYLQSLEYYGHFAASECEEEKRPSDFVHEHLKEIKLFGYTGTSHEIEFAKYLAKNCIVVEKITIRYKGFNYRRKRGFYEYEDNLDEEEEDQKREMENRIHEEVATMLHPNVVLLVD